MCLHRASLSLSSPEETTAFARSMSKMLRPSDVLLLEGPVGAGKTHFARGVVQALLTIPEDVPSPTFTLVQTYDGPECEIWHADLYRLTNPDEVIELGLLDAFETAISLVEWPDKLGSAVPKDALALSFTGTEKDDQRKLTLSWTAPRWNNVIEENADVRS